MKKYYAKRLGEYITIYEEKTFDRFLTNNLKRNKKFYLEIIPEELKKTGKSLITHHSTKHGYTIIIFKDIKALKKELDYWEKLIKRTSKNMKLLNYRKEVKAELESIYKKLKK